LIQNTKAESCRSVRFLQAKIVEGIGKPPLQDNPIEKYTRPVYSYRSMVLENTSTDAAKRKKARETKREMSPAAIKGV
jgi:hypothetical protein